MQEKVSKYEVRTEKSVTQDHCSASFDKPHSDPCDGFFCPYLIHMKDT